MTPIVGYLHASPWGLSGKRPHLGDIWGRQLLGSECLPVKTLEPRMRLYLLGPCLAASEAEERAAGQEAINEALELLRSRTGRKTEWDKRQDI